MSQPAKPGTGESVTKVESLGQLCDINDLDGTLFISRDRVPAMAFDQGRVSYPDGGWGCPA